jgi:hypothetical protein
LAEDEVVGSEQLTERSSSDGVHGTRLQVHEDGSGHVSSSGGLSVVTVVSLKLEIRVTMVSTSGVDTVLVRNDFPELSTDLVTALASLNVDNFSHDSY